MAVNLYQIEFHFFSKTQNMTPDKTKKNEWADWEYDDAEDRENMILEREWYRNNYNYYDDTNKKTLLSISISTRSPIICHEILKRCSIEWNQCDNDNENVLDYIFRKDRMINLGKAQNTNYEYYGTGNSGFVFNEGLTNLYQRLDFLSKRENEWISYLCMIHDQYPDLKCNKFGRNIFLCACFIGDMECVEKLISIDHTIVHSVDKDGLNGYSIASSAHQEHICQFLLFDYGIGPNADRNSQNSINRTMHKCILLGTASSGKSTMYKMIKEIYGKGMARNECIEARHVICQNLVASMIDLLRYSSEIGENEHKECWIDIDNEKNKDIKDAIECIIGYSSEGFYDESASLDWDNIKTLADSLHLVWNLEAIQNCVKKQGDMDMQKQLVTYANLDYFFDKVYEVFNREYVPSREDCLRTRVRTTGLIEMKYKIMNEEYRFIDVGGTRNERKKWIHHFENVDAVVFIASLASFNEALFEDETASSMRESVDLFDELIHCKWLKHRTKIYLLLGQNDRYRNVLNNKGPKAVDLIKNCFGEKDEDTLKYLVYDDRAFYSSATLVTHGFVHNIERDTNDLNDKYYFLSKDILKLIDLYCDAYWESFYEETVNYIRNKYLERNRNPNRFIKTYVLSYINQKDVEKVLYDITSELSVYDPSTIYVD